MLGACVVFAYCDVSEYVLYKVFDWFESGKTGQRYCSVLVAGFCHGRGCGGGIFPL